MRFAAQNAIGDRPTVRVASHPRLVIRPFADASNVRGTLASPKSPGLHGLGNNGGPTQTMALMSTSLARDTIPMTTDYRTPFTTVVDQRGVARPRNGNYDMGAYER